MSDQIPMSSPDLFYGWFESVRETFYESENLQQTLKTMSQTILAQPTTKIVTGNLSLNDAKIFDKSLQVQGDIILPGDQEMLIVAGDLTVDGDLIALGSDYSLVFVGGNLKCSNIATNGELVVLGKMNVSNLVLGVGNSYSSVGTELNSKYLVLSDDRGDFFDKINVQTKIEESTLTHSHKNLISKALSNSRSLKAIIDFYVGRGTEWEST